MHPIIRIACFLLLVIALTTGNRVFFFILPLLIYSYYAKCHLGTVLPLFKRLRWFFLFLLILNLWFSAPEWQWLPQWNELLIAIEHILALMTIVLAAHLLMSTTHLNDIIAALLWWLKPLSFIKVSTEKLAIRLALVLDTVNKVNHLYDNIQAQAKITTAVITLFTTVLAFADEEPLRILEIPELTTPPLWQWIIPILFIILIVLT